MVRKNAVRLWAVVFWLVVWQLGSMAFGQTLLLPSPTGCAVAVGIAGGHGGVLVGGGLVRSADF